MRTVDVVISGDGTAATTAAVDAVHRGKRVLVVLGSADAAAARRLRRCLRASGNAGDGQLTVMTNAEVVCVAGVGSVEAVVMRDLRTGRVRAVNASAFVACERRPTQA